MNKTAHNTDSQGVWEDFNRRLRSFVSRRVKQPADAEDIVQEIFIRIHGNLSSVQDEARLPAWIFTTARNAIADHFRKNSNPIETLPDDFDLPAMSAEDAPDAVALSELSKCLEPMIDDLLDSYREAIRLTELGGMTQLDAAAHAGLSVSGMKTRVQRGRRKLKEMLLQCCAIESDRRGGIVRYQPRKGTCNPCSTGTQNSHCSDSKAVRTD